MKNAALKFGDVESEKKKLYQYKKFTSIKQYKYKILKNFS